MKKTTNKPPKGTQAYRRFEICNTCEFLKFRKTFKLCKKCGCSTVLKAMIKTQECPIGKWEGIE